MPSRASRRFHEWRFCVRIRCPTGGLDAPVSMGLDEVCGAPDVAIGRRVSCRSATHGNRQRGGRRRRQSRTPCSGPCRGIGHCRSERLARIGRRFAASELAFPWHRSRRERIPPRHDSQPCAFRLAPRVRRLSYRLKRGHSSLADDLGWRRSRGALGARGASGHGTRRARAHTQATRPHSRTRARVLARRRYGVSKRGRGYPRGGASVGVMRAPSTSPPPPPDLWCIWSACGVLELTRRSNS